MAKYNPAAIQKLTRRLPKNTIKFNNSKTKYNN